MAFRKCITMVISIKWKAYRNSTDSLIGYQRNPTFLRLQSLSHLLCVHSDVCPLRRLSEKSFVFTNPTFVRPDDVCKLRRRLYAPTPEVCISYVFPFRRWSTPTFVHSDVWPFLRLFIPTLVRFDVSTGTKGCTLESNWGKTYSTTYFYVKAKKVVRRRKMILLELLFLVHCFKTIKLDFLYTHSKHTYTNTLLYLHT